MCVFVQNAHLMFCLFFTVFLFFIKFFLNNWCFFHTYFLYHILLNQTIDFFLTSLDISCLCVSHSNIVIPNRLHCIRQDKIHHYFFFMFSIYCGWSVNLFQKSVCLPNWALNDHRFYIDLYKNSITVECGLSRTVGTEVDSINEKFG